MSGGQLFRGAGTATVMALVGTVLSAAPSQGAEVGWAPLPGGNEALRLTGPGLNQTGPASPVFDGRTFTFAAHQGTSGRRRLFSIAAGQDLPTARALPLGLQYPTSRLSTPNGLFTTTSAAGGSLIHRIKGNTSEIVGVSGGGSRLIGNVGTKLILQTYDSKYFELDPTVDPADGSLHYAGSSPSGFMAGGSFYYSARPNGTDFSWWRISPTGSPIIMQGQSGLVGPDGLGELWSVKPFRDGVVATAAHAVHGNEVWFLPDDNTAPQLLTNVNDNGTTAPIKLLGTLGNRFWFIVGGATKKVYSSGGVLGDERVEMTDTHPDYTVYDSVQIGQSLVTARSGAGVHAYRSGAAAPTLLVPGPITSFKVSPDNKRVLVSRRPDANTVEWFTTDGTTAGTRKLPVFTPAGHQLATEGERNILVPGPGATYAYQLARGTVNEQFLVRPDRTVRLLKVTAPATQRPRRQGLSVKVKVRAGEKVRATATGSIKIPGTRAIRLNRVTLTAAKDRTGLLTLRVPKARQAALVRALQKKRTVRGTVKVVVRDANAGNVVTRTVTIRLV